MTTIVARGVPFGQIPHEITTDTEVSNAAYRVYGYLMMRANNETGRSWPGHRLMATELNMARSTIKAAVAVLETTGWVTVERPDIGATIIDQKVHKQVHRYVIHGSRPERLNLALEPLNRHENRTGMKTEPVAKSGHTGMKIIPEPVAKSVQNYNQNYNHELQPVVDEASTRPRDLVWDALVAIHGEPATKSERGKLNRVRSKLREAAVDHNEYPTLVAAYMAKHSKRGSPAPQPTAMTIAERVGELRHFTSNGPIGSPNGTADELADNRRRSETIAELKAEFEDATKELPEGDDDDG